MAIAELKHLLGPHLAAKVVIRVEEGGYVVVAPDGMTVLAEVSDRLTEALCAGNYDSLLATMFKQQVKDALAAYTKSHGKEAKMVKLKLKGTEAGVFPIEELQTVTPVKLSAATKLYEPVRGSGSSSRYFVVGICEGLKLACRIRAGTVSIRVEGTGLEDEEIRSHLKGVGFSNVTEKYGSFHVEAKSETLQAKTIGATLLSLSVDGWATALPDISLFTEKGS
jgi:hypothetical protein